MGRFDFGEIERFREFISNLLNRKLTGSENIHFSIAKIIMDQWEISTAQIDYPSSILHVMESTRLLTRSEFAWEGNHWPIWYTAEYIFSRCSFKSQLTISSSIQMHKMMLFSEK